MVSWRAATATLSEKSFEDDAGAPPEAEASSALARPPWTVFWILFAPAGGKNRPKTLNGLWML